MAKRSSTRHHVDLTLIVPGHRAEAYQSLARTLTAAEPPVWAGMLATHVRRKGYSVEIIDANALWLSPQQAAEAAAELNPRLAVVVVYGHNPSASTQTMPAAGEIARSLRARSPGTWTMFVGSHPAALPQRTLAEEQVDLICAGEGPLTVVETLDALCHGPGLEPGKIRGLWYRDGGKARRSPPAPLVTDLDQAMPAPAWDLLPMENYRAHNWQCFGGLDRGPYAAIYTTLGCPFSCSFCCIQAPFRDGERAMGAKKNSYRFISPVVIVEQLELLVQRYGVRNVRISDEMFVLHEKHVAAICDGIIERGLDLNIWAYARVQSIKPALMEKMKRAGINWLCLGIESGSPRVLADVGKRYKQQNVYRVIDEIRGAGINVIANYLVGLPEDDYQSMQQTVDLALELNCEFSNIYCAMAYPGSRLYEQAVQEGWPLPHSWVGYSQLAPETLPLPTRYLDGAQVLAFRDEAFNTIFGAQRYLEMIRGKFGASTADGIQRMTRHKLRRDHLPTAPDPAVIHGATAEPVTGP